MANKIKNIIKSICEWLLLIIAIFLALVGFLFLLLAITIPKDAFYLNLSGAIFLVPAVGVMCLWNYIRKKGKTAICVDECDCILDEDTIKQQQIELEERNMAEKSIDLIQEQPYFPEPQQQDNPKQLKQEQEEAQLAFEIEQQRRTELKRAARERIQRKIQRWDAEEQEKQEQSVEYWKKHKKVENSAVNQIHAVDRMDGHAFEHYCAQLLLDNGFDEATVTPGSGDQGVDILAEKEGIRYAIQCKNYTSKLSNSPVQEVNAGKVFYNCHVAVVMTNSTLTPGASALAKATNVLVWDRPVLKQMVANSFK